uniref:Uncharacterized protein n=1 Tax=Setaria italica TaxID=4555 RepID=K3YNQ8_SETIT
MPVFYPSIRASRHTQIVVSLSHTSLKLADRFLLFLI